MCQFLQSAAKLNMSHWFHRNSLKATLTVKFALKSVLTSESSSKICSGLYLSRDRFLELLRSASNDVEAVEKEFEIFTRLFYGFLYEIENEAAFVEKPEPLDFAAPFRDALNNNDSETKKRRLKKSKLRYLETFSWTNSMLGTEGLYYRSCNDAWFEALNICVNMALWYMKRAAWLSAKDEVREYDAKYIHTALRKAAGLFQFVSDNCDELHNGSVSPGNDMERNVIDSYNNQCQAEAQEITIARAMELKHAPTLISALATETANKYYTCNRLLERYPAEQFERWRTYSQLKHQIYMAYAYAYLGESLLASDACGEAVRACIEGMKCYDNAKKLCSKYAQARGPGFLARPEEHLFFRRIQPLLNRHLEKAKRENDFIYHQKVPTVCPTLTSNARFGLASSIPFDYPPASEEWTTISYAGFDISKLVKPSDFGCIKKQSKGIPMVKEEKCYETDRDPTNHSGCVIS